MERRIGYINTDGEVVVPLIYRSIAGFSEDRTFVFKDQEEGWYLNEQGHIVIDKVDNKTIKFGDVFRDGYTWVMLEDEEGTYIIDKNGEVILTPTEENYYYHNLGGGYFERLETGNIVNPQGVVDIYGNVVYDGKAMIKRPWNKYRGLYTYDNNMFGLLDNETFTEVTDERYSQISEFVDGLALVVTKDESVQLINPSGDVLVNLSEKYNNLDTEYISFHKIYDSLLPLNFTDNKHSIIFNTEDYTVRKTKYDYISSFVDGIAVCKIDNKEGYVDLYGNEILEPIYDDVTGLDQGIGYVKLAEVWYRFSINEN